jgi:hypothetical protein
VIGDGAIFAEELGRHLKMSTKRARRLMWEVFARYGETVVSAVPGKRGFRPWTTWAAWESRLPSLRSGGKDIFDRVSTLETEIARLKAHLGPQGGGI